MTDAPPEKPRMEIRKPSTAANDRFWRKADI